MNLAKLFLLQSELDAHIEESHPRLEGESRHDKKVLALLVELGELANEARFFKFWSKDHRPKTSGYRTTLNSFGEPYNPLLEEYVDGIHFLLSIGLENSIEELNIKPIKKHTLTEQFLDLYSVFSLMYVYFTPKCYSEAWSAYVGLAEMLGLSWDEVEAAYITKNEKNHARQEDGY
ncbi:dUTP diphosphatase [Neobacillus sp. MM2021_6]|uniref:dUTP diphosphatase n=1 Tax=Bacillaceae TaxID=186817 RepID=UPI00140E48F9|nr:MULTISPECIES: dUTP diphosphatase [Bacillaceae]MBO0959544.1 dUTP diphosphatase [Neobacillus sp. MM2021_6]NHC17158.1 dUTPase [Bacillus sp. MM2020_4]